jgi:hypothetical protein
MSLQEYKVINQEKTSLRIHLRIFDDIYMHK